MAKKILAQSDFDLVLTEYYKERLEFQLKNRGINTNKKKLIESIVLLLPIHLPIVSNWISTLKPLSLKPSVFLLIFLSSFLFLLFQLT